jgi:hypothetical protein
LWEHSRTAAAAGHAAVAVVVSWAEEGSATAGRSKRAEVQDDGGEAIEPGPCWSRDRAAWSDGRTCLL